jgi:hypothetical protein
VDEEPDAADADNVADAQQHASVEDIPVTLVRSDEGMHETQAYGGAQAVPPGRSPPGRVAPRCPAPGHG